MSAYEPLYLKYRPQTLGDLIGQNSVKQTLVNAISHGRLVHAYLFTGPRGAGKTSTARILAKCLNCLNAAQLPTFEPCGTCASCLDIANSNSLDVIEIDAASHGGVEDARSLIERVNLGTISGNHKVYIIDEVHMLSTAAFNALLKVFEEPPAKVVFILATTEEDKVLPTIRSRCQSLQFRPITVNDCVARLRYVADKEQIKIDDDALEFIAKRSDGAMRDALGILDQAAAFMEQGSQITRAQLLDYVGAASREEVETLLNPVLKRDTTELITALEALFDRGKEPIALARELSNLLLEILEQGQATSRGIENFELVQILDQLTLVEEKLKRTSQAKNLFRAALLKILYRADILVVKDLLERIDRLEQNSNTHRTSSERVISAPKPVFVQALPKQAETKPPIAPAQNLSEPTTATNSLDFAEYLSPSAKGLLQSTNAKLSSVANGQATLSIPERYKFLQSKLEAKSAEIIAAIARTNPEVNSLQVILVANDATVTLPPTLDTKYQQVQPRSLDEVKTPVEVLAESRLETASYDEPLSNASSQGEYAHETPQVDSPVNDDSVNSKQVKFASTKLEEAVGMAKTVFSAKLL